MANIGNNEETSFEILTAEHFVKEEISWKEETYKIQSLKITSYRVPWLASGNHWIPVYLESNTQ